MLRIKIILTEPFDISSVFANFVCTIIFIFFFYLTLPLVWLTLSQSILPFKLLSHSVISLESRCLFRWTFHLSDVCITVLANLFCHISVHFIGNSLTGYRQRSECFIVPCNTPFSSSKQHTQRCVEIHAFSCVTRTHLGELSKHTLVCSQNPFLVVFRACPKFDTLSGVFCRMMCFVTLVDA